MRRTDEDIINLFLDPFCWDSKSYRFDRDEKDMCPYSVIKKEKDLTIVHNILGIDKKDLRITVREEQRKPFIVIEGKTKDALTNKLYSVNSKFGVDDAQLDLNNVHSSTKNGLLYITIPYNSHKAIADINIPVE